MPRRFLSLSLTLLLLFFLPLGVRAEETDAREEPSPSQIIYVTAPGEPIFFRSEDFEDFCQQATGHELQCVSFSYLSPRSGSLWYIAEEGEKQITPDVILYPYHAPVLSRAWFQPNSRFTGQAELSFTLTSRKEETVSGSLLLYVPPELDVSPETSLGEADQVAKVGEPVSLGDLFPFRTTSKDEVELLAFDGVKVTSVTLTLPLSSQGSLWLNYGDSDARKLLPEEALSPEGMESFYALSFVPAHKEVDTVSLQYTVSSGRKKAAYTGTLTLHFADDKIPIRPPASTPEPAPARFTDMAGWEWAFSAAEELNARFALRLEQEDTLFRPGDHATRMEVLHSLVQTAYPGNYDPGVTTFPDLPQDPSYARSAAFAFVRGLALGDEAGRLNPDDPITRQDALVLLYRALLDQNRELPAPGDLSQFSDQDALAPYARETAGVLLAAGILQGDEAHQLQPRSPITRAEMAVLICRAFPG